MPEANDNAFMRFLNEKLVPFSTRVGQNKYIQAIGQGSMGLMAIILVGSIFNLLNTLPVEPYQAFITSNGISDVLNAVYNASMNFTASSWSRASPVAPPRALATRSLPT